jgi:hypothetical protein
VIIELSATHPSQEFSSLQQHLLMNGKPKNIFFSSRKYRIPLI